MNETIIFKGQLNTLAGKKPFIYKLEQTQQRKQKKNHLVFDFILI